MKLKLLTFLIAPLVLLSCAGSKKLHHPVYVKVIDNASYVTGGVDDKYLTASGDVLDSLYMADLKAYLLEKNVVVRDTGYELIIRVTSKTVSTKTKSETVDNAKSKQHGEKFSLNQLTLVVSGDVYSATTDHVVDEWTEKESDGDELTNKRTLIQIAAGTNKDGTIYRVKEMDDDVLRSCANRIGSDIGYDVVRIIRKKVL